MPPQRGNLWLDREDIDDVTVVRFTVPHLRQEDTNRSIFQLLFSLADSAGRRHLVLNLGQVESVTSDAIGQLVLLNRKVQAAGGRLVLCDVTPEVAEVFETMHLERVFDTYDSEQEAVQSFLMLEREAAGDVTILRVRPRAPSDEDVAFIFEELHRLVAQAGRRKLVLCCRNVESLSDATLADLGRLDEEKVRGPGGQLILCHLNLDVYEHLGKPPLKVCGDEHQAVHAF